MEFDDAQQLEAQSEPTRRNRPRTVHAARTWATVLTAFFSELVIIGVTNNQGMTDWVSRKVGSGQSFADHLARASQVYHWRFNYHHIAPFSAAGDGIRIGALVVLTALLLVPVVRGSVTFVRAFFGTWLVVVVATVLAQFAGAVPKPNFGDPAVQQTATRMFDSYLAPSANGVAGGVGLGFLVALITAGVAVGTRRALGTVQPAAAVEPEDDDLPYEPPPPPPPWNPPVEEPPRWAPAPSYQQPPWSREAAETVETVETPPAAATAPWPSMPADQPDHSSATERLGPDEEAVRIDEEEDLATR